MKLLPPKEGTCPVCARDHEQDMPHDVQSLYYQYRFHAIRHRWPTWADALAHCSDKMRQRWEQLLREKGVWSEPEDGDPIADPPNESFRHLIDTDYKIL